MLIWYVGFDCGRSAGSEQCSTSCIQGKRILQEGQEERKEQGKKENTVKTDIKKEEGGVGSIGQGNKQKIVRL
jgi:hypothetical protein